MYPITKCLRDICYGYGRFDIAVVIFDPKKHIYSQTWRYQDKRHFD